MTEQPMPTQAANSESVTDALIADLRHRQAKGITTYGTSLMTFNGRDPIRDALEEVLDLAQYLKQIQMERDAMLSELRAKTAIADQNKADAARFAAENRQLRVEVERLTFQLEEAKQ